MASLVARDDEVASAIRSVRAGHGVVIVGEAGVGKTALASAVAERAGPDAPAAWIVATAASRLVPFGALGALLPADMATVHPALVPSLVAKRLRELARGGSPLLAIDDAQLLDDHSAAAVLALVTGRTARLLATVRSGAPASDAITALWKDNLLDRLDLRPLDRDATRVLLADRLGGEVASGTVELLWGRSQGNPLYLTELVRFGTDTGRLRLDAGVWWWSGGTGLPLRLGELLQRRLDELTSAARDTLDVLALGDGLPYETLAAVVEPEAILEVEEHGVVRSDERDGVLRLRFAHPLLHDVAERRLTPARRRALAERLRTAPAGHVDVVRRAEWENATGGRPNVDLLLAAADSIMLSDPHGAVEFAERALQHDGSSRPALALSAAQSEAGRPELARAAWRLAVERVRTDADRLETALEDISLSLWVDRAPDRAHLLLAQLRADLPCSHTDDLDSSQALVTLFTARPDRALRMADAVLGREPAPSPLIRALTAKLAAHTVLGHPAETMQTASRLLAALASTPVAATRSGLAHAFVAEARLFHGRDYDLPRMAGSSGRWPTGPEQDVSEPAPAWPLLVGVRHHLEGNWHPAVTAFREAFVQQRTSEGLFRSEAAAGLIVVLAESGRAKEAAELLAESPPDGVALNPGLLPWAQAAVQAANGPSVAAGGLALQAAEDAFAVGALLPAVWYLADAARFGGPRVAEAAAEALPPEAADTPLYRARADGIRARAGLRLPDLVDAADQHLRLGLYGHAAELADLALGDRTRAGGLALRAGRIRRDALTRLGQETVAPTRTGLTRRELEIARMAASGMTDRDIAGSLVVSVRTVQTHLRSAYRKLNIGSRRALAEALQPPLSRS